MKIFGQRNGVFFALSIIALLGATVGLLQQAWRSFAGGRDASDAPSVVLRSSDATSSEPPFLVEALRLEPPEPTLPRVRAIRDLVTTVGARSYRIRRGDTFLMVDEKPGKFVIAANELLAQVPSDAVEQLAPQPVRSGAGYSGNSQPGAEKVDRSTALQTEQRSRAEAARRYPALAKAGSAENRTFLETYNNLKQRKSDMLDDPEWPLLLAEYLAQRLGWEEANTDEEGTGASIPSLVEPKIAPGTRMLADPNAPTSPDSAEDDSRIPRPPRTPR
jgi:hypothetical protein